MEKIEAIYIPTNDTKERWEARNEILLKGMLAVETDTGKIKVGDGEKRYREIAYAIGDEGPQGEPGEKGEPFRYEDFTAQQLESLKVKGDPGKSALALWQEQHPQGTLEEFLAQLHVSIDHAAMAEDSKKLGGKEAEEYISEVSTIKNSLNEIEVRFGGAIQTIGYLCGFTYLGTSPSGVIQADCRNLITQDKTSLVAAINELASKTVDLSQFFKSGMGSFAGGNQEVTITHGGGKAPQFVDVRPSENPGGFLGEVWVRWDETNIYVGNSGSFTGGFSYLAYF